MTQHMARAISPNRKLAWEGLICVILLCHNINTITSIFLNQLKGDLNTLLYIQ